MEWRKMNTMERCHAVVVLSFCCCCYLPIFDGAYCFLTKLIGDGRSSQAWTLMHLIRKSDGRITYLTKTSNCLTDRRLDGQTHLKWRSDVVPNWWTDRWTHLIRRSDQLTDKWIHARMDASKKKMWRIHGRTDPSNKKMWRTVTSCSNESLLHLQRKMGCGKE